MTMLMMIPDDDDDVDDDGFIEEVNWLGKVRSI